MNTQRHTIFFNQNKIIAHKAFGLCELFYNYTKQFLNKGVRRIFGKDKKICFLFELATLDSLSQYQKRKLRYRVAEISFIYLQI